MSKNINLSFEIRLGDEDFSSSIIYFNKWIPTELNPIVAKTENSTLKLWIDKDCIQSVFEKDDERISTWSNISVYKIKASVLITNVNDELATFIYDERDSSRELHYVTLPSDEKYNELNKAFIDLGDNALELTYKTCNQIIAYARNEKGQYHLEQLTYDKKMLRSLYIHLNAKCQIDNEEWFRWNPSSIDCIDLIIGADEENITEEDWGRIQNFIRSNSRTNLVNELSSNAMSLLFKYGHRRSAVIEASTALEVALSKFSENPDFEKMGLLSETGRIDTKNLKNQIKHLGFSGSMKYLIPIIFNETIFPTELLTKCHNAIDARNNIVHQGQRDISETLAKEYILALKKASETLREHTKEA
jgi:hypothetical protein